MALQIINLGTLADGSDGDTNKVAWGKAKDNFAELYGRMVGKGYISGLQMKWVSGTALTLTSGAAYIEGTGSVLFSDSDIAKTALSLSASTWYHAYVYDNAGTPDFILSTTAPAAAYNSTARSMTGDSSKRYAGSVKTTAAGAIRPFVVRHDYLQFTDGFTNVLSAGAATSATSVSLSSAVPVTGVSAMVVLRNSATSAYAAIGYPGTTLPSQYATVCSANTYYGISLLCDSSQNIAYAMSASPGTGGLYIDVVGYSVER